MRNAPSAWLPDCLASLFSGDGPHLRATEIAGIAAECRRQWRGIFTPGCPVPS